MALRFAISSRARWSVCLSLNLDALRRSRNATASCFSFHRLLSLHDRVWSFLPGHSVYNRCMCIHLVGDLQLQLQVAGCTEANRSTRSNGLMHMGVRLVRRQIPVCCPNSEFRAIADLLLLLLCARGRTYVRETYDVLPIDHDRERIRRRTWTRTWPADVHLKAATGRYRNVIAETASAWPKGNQGGSSLKGSLIFDGLSRFWLWSPRAAQIARRAPVLWYCRVNNGKSINCRVNVFFILTIRCLALSAIESFYCHFFCHTRKSSYLEYARFTFVLLGVLRGAAESHLVTVRPSGV